MRTLLSLILLFPSLFVAQDYQTVRSDFIRFFETSDQNGTYYHGIKVDSTIVSGQDSILFNYWTVRSGNSFCNQSDRILPYGPSFIGREILIRPNGDNVFINNLGDSILIKTLAQLNESWVMMELENSIVLRATVSDISNESILDSLIEVKTILTEMLDSAGNVITHSANGEHFRISNHLGIVKTPDIALFPGDVNIHAIAGMEKPYRGMYRPRCVPMYARSIGDAEHWAYGYDNWPHSNGWRKIEAITNAEITGSTSQEYTLHTAKEYWSDSDPSTITSFEELDSTYMVDLSDPAESCWLPMPGQSDELMYLDTGGTTEPWDHSISVRSIGFDYHHCFGPERITNDGGSLMVPDTVNNDGCYESYPWISESVYHMYSVADEVGTTQTTTTWYANDITSATRSLQYFKRGDLECGIPYTFWVGVEETEKPISSIFPNPIHSGQTLNLGKTWSEVSVSNLNGQILWEARHVSQLTTDNLKSGIYFLSLANDGLRSTQKLVVLE